MSDEERSLAIASSRDSTPEQAGDVLGGDLQTRNKLSPDPAPVSSSEDGASLKGSNDEQFADPAGEFKNEEEESGEGCAKNQRSGGESGSEGTTPVPSKDSVDDAKSNTEPSNEQANGDKSDEEESSNGRERRRRRNGNESSSEEDSFADAVDDMQNLASSSEIPPSQPLREEGEERTPATEEDGTESDDRSISGDSQEWDRRSEERKERNLDWAEKEEQNLLRPEEEKDGEGENGEEPEDGDEEPEDGDEEEEKEEISKDSPMYVPKGIYFEHDSRSEEQDENEANKIPSPKPQSRSETAEKWEHDLYIEEEQKPRTQLEKERDHRRLEEWESRRSQGPRSSGTLGEYMPPRRRKDDRIQGRYNNDRYSPRDRQPNRRGGQQQAVEKDRPRYNQEYPQRSNASQRSRERGGPSNRRDAERTKTKENGAIRSRDRGTSNQRAGDETRSSSNRNRDRRVVGHRTEEEPWGDNAHSKEPTNSRAAEEPRRSPRPSRNNARDQSHTSPSSQGSSVQRPNRNDSKEPPTESPSYGDSSAPKSLFQQHGEAARSFSNSRVFSLDQRSQRVTVKEVEAPSLGGSQQNQPSSRIRRPLGRGRGIIKRVTDPAPGLPGNKVGATAGDVAPTSPPPSASEVKEIAPFDERTSDEANARQSPKARPSHPCKSQVSSDHTLHKTLLAPYQEEGGSPPKKGKEKESILGEPPPSIATGKPKRYSSQRQKAPPTAPEELVEEPAQLDYSLSGPTPWMVPYAMMDPTSLQRQAIAMMQSQQFAQQVAFLQQQQHHQQLRLMHEYQQGTPPHPPPIGPHNAPYPMEMPPPMMPYLPPPIPQPPVPASHPEPKVPMVQVPLGAEGFPEQGGLFIPGMNPEQQRFYPPPGATPKHSQAIPIVPPAEQNL